LFGPLARDVSAAQRQRLVDDFVKVDGHAVLLAQVQVGGTDSTFRPPACRAVRTAGQAEPRGVSDRPTPSHGADAIRAGTHRLLIAATVDQRMIGMLGA
jgi:hypothetical protein